MKTMKYREIWEHTKHGEVSLTKEKGRESCRRKGVQAPVGKGKMTGVGRRTLAV